MRTWTSPERWPVKTRCPRCVCMSAIALTAPCPRCSNLSPTVSIRQHTSAYASIRQHTPAYVSIRRFTCLLLYARAAATCRLQSAYVSIRQHTPAYASIRQHTSVYLLTALLVPLQQPVACSQHTSAHASIRQHTSAYLRRASGSSQLRALTYADVC